MMIMWNTVTKFLYKIVDKNRSKRYRVSMSGTLSTHRFCERTPRSLLFKLSVVAWLLSTGVSSAHPVPKSEYDRNITVVVKADQVVVTYRLEIDPFTLFHDVGQNDSGFKLDQSRKLTLDDFARSFIERMRLVIPDHLVATLNDKPLAFQASKTSFSHPDSVQFFFVFRAPIKPLLRNNRFEFEEINFSDKKGTLKLTFDTVESVTFLDFTEPSQRKLPNLDERKQRTLTATFDRPPELLPQPRLKGEPFIEAFGAKVDAPLELLPQPRLIGEPFIEAFGAKVDAPLELPSTTARPSVTDTIAPPPIEALPPNHRHF